MGIFSRLSDIINSNLNAVLEKAEDPEKIIRLMIQEMEDTLVDVRSSAARTIADKKERERHHANLLAEAHDWEQKAELAISKDREDLARAALAEKNNLEDEAAALSKELGLLDEQLQKLNHDISQLQAKLNDAKARQRTMVMRHKTASNSVRMRKQIHDDKMDEMLNRFESAERRIDHIESEAESLAMGRGKNLAEEIADLESDERVDDQLAQLKAKMNKKSDA